jgi:hypothetical protein
MTHYGLIVARLDPPPELEEEFNDWYDIEHIPERLRVGFFTARRIVRDARPRYLACYDLETLAVLDSEAYRNVSGENRSAWTARMLRKTRLFERRVYEQVLPGREAVEAAHPYTVMRTIAGGDPDSLRSHVEEARRRPDVSARLFIGRQPAQVAGQLLVLYTAASEEAAAWCAGEPAGGEVSSFGPYRREAREDDRFTQLPESPRAASHAFYRRGYTDGLPIIPPSEELVAEMVAGQSRPREEMLGRMPPRDGAATVEALAVNAVMAGCHPEHFPVVLAAVEALLDPALNLLGVQATTHPVSPCLVISGPIRAALGFNLSGNAMGEGTLANATIGRAIRLILRNIGGARPGRTDFTTQGSPARYGFVVAENEEVSPFPPFHTSIGFDAAQSVVTVFASEGPHNVNDHSSDCGESLLEMIGGTMATFATNDLGRGGKPLVVIGPEHARILGRDGFTREKVQRYLFENARVRLEVLPREMREWLEERHDIDRSVWTARGIPLADRPEDIFVMVAGGKGRHSCFMPNFAFGRPVARPIAFTPTGAPPPSLPECDC